MSTISAKDTIPGSEAANTGYAIQKGLLVLVWWEVFGGSAGPESHSGAGLVAALLPVSDVGCGSAVPPPPTPSHLVVKLYISPVCHLPLCSGVICIDRRGRCAEGYTLNEAVQAVFYLFYFPPAGESWVLPSIS